VQKSKGVASIRFYSPQNALSNWFVASDLNKPHRKERPDRPPILGLGGSGLFHGLPRRAVFDANSNTRQVARVRQHQERDIRAGEKEEQLVLC
jgi:hypothetical protein